MAGCLQCMLLPLQNHQEFTLTHSDGEVAYAVGGLFRDTDCDREAFVNKVAFCW